MKLKILIAACIFSLSQNALAMQIPLSAADHFLTTAEDRPIDGSLKGLVRGGTPPYKFIGYGDPYPSGHSSLKLNADGTFTFTPYNNFIGQGSFRYKAYDNNNVSSNVGTVYINIEDYY